MKWPIAVLLLSLLIQVEGKLCKRPGCFCKNNGIPIDKNCECPTGYKGFDCGLKTRNLCPTNICKNDGVCYDMGKCYCHGDFYGDHCEYRKEPQNCGMDSMQVGFAMPVTMDSNPEIFALPNTKCKFKRAYEIKGHDIYMLEVNLTTTRNANCMDAVVETRMGDMTTYLIDAHVRRDHGMDSPRDWTATFRCTYTSIGTPTQRDVTAEASDVLFAFTDANETLVDNIGAQQPFDIVFFLRPNSTYLNLRLDKLVVYNQLSNTKMFTLIDRGRSDYMSRRLKLYREPTDEGQTPFYFEVAENVTVPAVKVKVSGLSEKASIYVDYEIRVCQTHVCPMSVDSTFGQQAPGIFNMHGRIG
ncbi:EGF-like domain-containing protein 2 [Ylistrum balloti]|uniref:EGF-like domain-containing protein 2 n=1 Tax=Ylistrum balloti TaxID=509963 RepID=UPI002905BDA0|nr:EGF-like domain-containing protein 2 [Ylistrum balloti]